MHWKSFKQLPVPDHLGFPSVSLLKKWLQRPFSALHLWVQTYSFCWMSGGRVTVLKIMYMVRAFEYVLANYFQRWQPVCATGIPLWDDPCCSSLSAGLAFIPSGVSELIISTPHAFWPLILSLVGFCPLFWWDVYWFAIILYILRILVLYFTNILQNFFPSFDFFMVVCHWEICSI